MYYRVEYTHIAVLRKDSPDPYAGFHGIPNPNHSALTPSKMFREFLVPTAHSDPIRSHIDSLFSMIRVIFPFLLIYLTSVFSLESISVKNMSKSKVCAVFGYGPGLGAAVARKWSKEGFSVALMSRTLDKVKVRGIVSVVPEMDCLLLLGLGESLSVSRYLSRSF